MTTKKRVEEHAISYWHENFAGVSALSAAEALGVSHEAVLDAFDELEAENRGSQRKPISLCAGAFTFTLGDPNATDDYEEVESAIFFPAQPVLEKSFYESELSRRNLPAYKVRLHRGYSQIQLLYFKAAVLGRYIDHPELFIVDDSVAGGNIRTRDGLASNVKIETDADNFGMIDFGKRILIEGKHAVTAILHDLSELPETHQRHWHSYEIDHPRFRADDPDFENFVKRQLRAEWTDYNDPLIKALAELDRINLLLGEPPLFRNVKNDYLAYPVKNSFKDYCDCCSELYKLVGPDNLNAEVLRGFLRTHFDYSDERFVHTDSGRPMGTLQLLRLVAAETSATRLMGAIEEVKTHRIDADHKVTQPSVARQNYMVAFRQVCTVLCEGLIEFGDCLEKIR